MTNRLALQRVGLGGGCFWCTEAVFLDLSGVVNVTQVFAFSYPPDDDPSEAVLVDFDPSQIGLRQLIDIHLRTHASTYRHALRKKYRSAVYTFDNHQREQAARIVTGLQQDFSNTLITRVLPFVGFEQANAKYQDYYAKNRGNQFCQRYIDPKLERLRRDYAHLSRFGGDSWAHRSIDSLPGRTGKKPA